MRSRSRRRRSTNTKNARSIPNSGSSTKAASGGPNIAPIVLAERQQRGGARRRSHLALQGVAEQREDDSGQQRGRQPSARRRTTARASSRRPARRPSVVERRQYERMTLQPLAAGDRRGMPRGARPHGEPPATPRGPRGQSRRAPRRASGWPPASSSARTSRGIGTRPLPGRAGRCRRGLAHISSRHGREAGGVSGMAGAARSARSKRLESHSPAAAADRLSVAAVQAVPATPTRSTRTTSASTTPATAPSVFHPYRSPSTCPNGRFVRVDAPVSTGRVAPIGDSGQQEEGKCRRKANKIDDPRRVTRKVRQRYEERGEVRERDREGDAADGDNGFEHGVRSQGALEAAGAPRDQPVADRQSGHEAGQHQARRPDAVTEYEARSMKPDDLEHEACRT